MILGITKLHTKLLKEVCNENNIENVQVLENVNSLNKFARQEMNNLNNFKYVIIDITSTKENDEDIVKSIVAIKSMYEIRIIIMALGYKEDSQILAQLFNEGVYNFVIGDDYNKQKEEFKKCLSEFGNCYKDAVKFRNEIKTIYSNSKVIIKKEFSRLKRTITVGISGTEQNIGVTTQCILIATFFNSNNIKVCYIPTLENNIISSIENYKNSEIKVKDEKIINYKNIDMYKNRNSIGSMDYGYDCYIYDYGRLTEDNINSFLEKDIKIVVSGAKVWELDDLFSSIMKVSKDVNYILNFADNEEQKSILKELNKYKDKIFFSEYIPNPFTENVNNIIYENVFKDVIVEKNNKLQIIDEKKSIFDFFKRKKR